MTYERNMDVRKMLSYYQTLACPDIIYLTSSSNSVTVAATWRLEVRFPLNGLPTGPLQRLQTTFIFVKAGQSIRLACVPKSREERNELGRTRIV